ncbi:MAG: GNAT family N-acetyltransferase [Flavobacteriaceae bacterium]|nr:GNAT family N-acetyltransferase [Bacteroidia bacterium]NNK87026.1 GNAT family N-acetyltransferase [Flavobacteriaceae bacterium]
MKYAIVRAHVEHVPDLIPLFDAYRMFYRQHSDFSGAQQFLKDRLSNNESVVFIAFADENAIGFVQLFPVFSSVTMEPMYILNDLYVEENYRGKGIGKMLIDQAKDLCREKKLKGLVLQTEADNPAQQMYEHLQFKQDTDLHYFWLNTDR